MDAAGGSPPASPSVAAAAARNEELADKLAALYAKAAGQNAQARQLYNASADTYYKANDAAAYDDWVRARNHWDYFYNRS